MFQLHIGELDLAADLGMNPSTATRSSLTRGPESSSPAATRDSTPQSAPDSPVVDQPEDHLVDTVALARMGFAWSTFHA